MPVCCTSNQATSNRKTTLVLWCMVMMCTDKTEQIVFAIKNANNNYIKQKQKGRKSVKQSTASSSTQSSAPDIVATYKTAVVDTAGDYNDSVLVPSCPPATPPYQRLTKALQCDPRCGHELSGEKISNFLLVIKLKLSDVKKANEI
ncbi:unnamed protein product [Ceratitis capitata]|uniref:(Mediterranean fruit fly) hypothetical protein n=1 Tax=Ceratitis capitata TaxID=7213 RepID=A0A811UQ91_CERCA|nr:unnamed protein product [Ceratitis capitata]